MDRRKRRNQNFMGVLLRKQQRAMIKARGHPIEIKIGFDALEVKHVEGFTFNRSGKPDINVDKPSPQIPKARLFKSPTAYAVALQKRGFKVLGRGHFSTVYGKEGYSRVIKVTHYEDNWIDYALWAAKRGWAGKFAPQVYSFRKHTNEFRVSVVERLDRTLRDLERSHAFRLVGDLVMHADQDNLMANLFLEELEPGLPAFLGDFKKAFGCGRRDFHDGNWMVRGQKLVLTDPVCGNSNETNRRLKAGDFSPALHLRRYYG